MAVPPGAISERGDGITFAAVSSCHPLSDPPLHQIRIKCATALLAQMAQNGRNGTNYLTDQLDDSSPKLGDHFKTPCCPCPAPPPEADSCRIEWTARSALLLHKGAVWTIASEGGRCPLWMSCMQGVIVLQKLIGENFFTYFVNLCSFFSSLRRHLSNITELWASGALHGLLSWPQQIYNTDRW